MCVWLGFPPLKLFLTNLPESVAIVKVVTVWTLIHFTSWRNSVVDPAEAGVGGEKHEIYMAAFGGHLFLLLIFTGGANGPFGPLDPLLRNIKKLKTFARVSEVYEKIYFKVYQACKVHGIVCFGDYTLQEHQRIRTNATVSKISDIENEWWSMRKKDF